MIEQMKQLELGVEVPEVFSPPLKWAGGKRWQVPLIRPAWGLSKSNRLVEPFVGGMAVSLGLSPQKALLNDINHPLINFYRWLQSGLVAETKFLNDEKHFYRMRERFNKLITSGEHASQEAAEIFYYLNRTCFNGLCRFSSKGEFNVPFGKYKTINYTKDFLKYVKPLKNWEFTNLDFEELEIEADDFIYADPPYDVEFTTYSKEGFDWEEQKRLVKWLSKFSNPIILVNQATSRVVDLYKSAGFKLFFLDAPRRISSNGDRTPAKEVMAVKGLGAFSPRAFILGK